MNKMLLYGALLACCSALAFTGMAGATADKGPEEMTLESTIDPAKTPRTSQFPHGAHQALMECGTCHHGADAEGKRIDYTEGMAIEKCESCHNSSSSMPDKLRTFKDAGHGLCVDCHRTTDKELAKCNVCHK